LSDFGGVLRKKHADDDGLLSADPRSPRRHGTRGFHVQNHILNKENQETVQSPQQQINLPGRGRTSGVKAETA
jgi:hypothetical protein